MSPETIAVITVGIGLAGLLIGLAGLIVQLSRNTNRRFDDLKNNIDRRFDDFKTEINQRFDTFKTEVDQRFDDVNRRFDDAARQNEAAHAHIASNISELRADFRTLIPRPAAERPNRPEDTDRNPAH